MHRIWQRGARFGLDYFESENRARQTIFNGAKSTHKHITGKNPIYYQYFNDGLAFYVVCKEHEFPKQVYVRVITVIIERGRE